MSRQRNFQPGTNVNCVFSDASSEKKLEALNRQRVTSMFFEKGISLGRYSKTEEEVFSELEALVDEYVQKGYDRANLLLYIKRGIERSQQIKEADTQNRGLKR